MTGPAGRPGTSGAAARGRAPARPGSGRPAWCRTGRRRRDRTGASGTPRRCPRCGTPSPWPGRRRAAARARGRGGRGCPGRTRGPRGPRAGSGRAARGSGGGCRPRCRPRRPGRRGALGRARRPRQLSGSRRGRATRALGYQGRGHAWTVPKSGAGDARDASVAGESAGDISIFPMPTSGRSPRGGAAREPATATEGPRARRMDAPREASGPCPFRLSPPRSSAPGAAPPASGGRGRST